MLPRPALMHPPHSLYIAGDSRLHRLHPLTRLSFLLAALLIVFLGPGGAWPAGMVLVLALLLAGRSRLLRPAARSLLRTVAPLALVLLVVHGLFGPHNQTALLALGPFTVGQEGVEYALRISLRLAAALAASLLFVYTTPPRLLMLAAENAGLPPALTYLLGSPLILLPQVLDRAAAILAAQRSRGLETEGRLVHRVLSLFPLVAPLVFGLLVEVEERAIALEARAFSASGRKTSLVTLEDPPAERRMRRLALAAGLLTAAAGVGWRWYAAG